MTFSKKKEELRRMIPDFARELAPVYEHLKWYWKPKEEKFIPQAKDIEKTLRILIDDLTPRHSVSTGGLLVYHDVEERTMGMLFSVERWIHMDKCFTS